MGVEQTPAPGEPPAPAPEKEPMMPSPSFVSSERPAFAFDRNIPPVLEVAPGSVVSFQTDLSVLDRLAAGEPPASIGMERLNALAGPVAVLGAEPGDALRIEVLDIQIDRAWSVWLPGFGPLGARTDRIRVMQTPIQDGRLTIGANRSVPLEPMIGCIGVAPAEGVGSTLRPVYPFGGNMDLRELSVGATLWLPVQVPGALLSVGDFHAAMGQGEPTAVALEAAGVATLRIDLEKRRALPSPRLRVGDDTMLIGLGADHVEARQNAIGLALDFLVEECGFEVFEAYAYASARVGVRFGGPAGATVLAVVPNPK
jgi:amidase